MDKRKKIVIDGLFFNDMEEFYVEMEKVLTNNIDFRIGHNLSAFNDLLRGGFGIHDYAEPIDICWKNFDRSIEMLGYESVLRIMKVILDGEDTDHDCKLSIIR